MAVESTPPGIPSLDISAAVKDPAMIEALKFTRPKQKEEIAQEITIKDREHWFKIITQSILFITATAAVAIGLFLCIEIIRNPTASADDKKWATTVIYSVITALVGFLIGKGAGSSSTDKN